MSFIAITSNAIVILDFLNINTNYFLYSWKCKAKKWECTWNDPSYFMSQIFIMLTIFISVQSFSSKFTPSLKSCKLMRSEILMYKYA